MGALIYIDDLVLSASNTKSMRSLLSICESYANVYTIVFNS